MPLDAGNFWRLTRVGLGFGACAVVAYAAYQPRGRGVTVSVNLTSAASAVAANEAAPFPSPPPSLLAQVPAAPIAPATQAAPATQTAPATPPPTTAPTTAPAPATSPVAIAGGPIVPPADAPPTTAPATTAPVITPPALPDPAALAEAEARELEAAAYASESQADFLRAAEALERAAELNPEDLRLRQSAGFIWLDRLKQPGRAIPHLEQVAAVTPPPDGWESLLARAYTEAGRRDDAIGVWRRAVAHNAGNAWSWVDLAKLLAKSGQTADADGAFITARQVAPADPQVALAHAEHLAATGRRPEAKRIAQDIVARNPDTTWGQGLLGDLHRADAEHDLARRAYDAALRLDRNWYPAVAGMMALEASRAPRLSSAYFRFRDSDQFEQDGIFNTLSVGLDDQLTLHAGLNARWFSGPVGGTVHRLEESAVFDFRFNRGLSLQAGATAFQTEGAGGNEVGGVAGLFWQHDVLQASATYRLNEPVNDSILTAREAFTQDVLAGTMAWQVTDRFSLAANASTADYSDGNTRRYGSAEASYQIVPEWSAYARLQYEWIDFDESRPGYSSPSSYQYIRPIIEARPQLAPWLRLNARVEFPFVVDESRWGTGVIVGPEFRINDRFTLDLSYFRYDLPGAFTNYSGEGFKVNLRLQP